VGDPRGPVLVHAGQRPPPSRFLAARPT
jgi:hypothetical protein